MARKRLIKGANAARVEARISRVPADIGEEASIFGALRALEGDAAPSAVAAPQEPAAAITRAPAAKRAAPRAARPVAKAAAKGPAAASPGQPAKAPSQPRHDKLRPIDFSAAERRAILRCCKDYRNRLPTYLLSVQKEVKVLDSIIEKCGPDSSD
jgi:hypothetical protein